MASDDNHYAGCEYSRAFALEDISIRMDGDGQDRRTVEAYAAVFNSPSVIYNQEGEYEEVIDPAAFNRVIEHANRSKHGIPVLYNHGKTIYGTPSEAGSLPIGVSEEIKADERGLLTRARFTKTQLADNVLESIRDGSITAYSFQGAFRRSTPTPRRGGFRRDKISGELTTVRRTESTLREFGPTPFPAYSDAAIVGVRAEQAAMLLSALAPGERHRLAEMLTSGTPDLGPAADDPPSQHSTRHLNIKRARIIRGME